MRLLTYLSFLLIFFLNFDSIAQQQYRSHYVKAGETIFSIAKNFGVTTDAIYKLNPDITNNLKVNTLLIIPEKGKTISDNVEVDLKKHKVRRKETLFSIAQLYNVTVDDIKKYNKELYSKPLKKGKRIMIPIPKKTKYIVNTKPDTVSTKLAKYTVAAKETKYGIARKYGITIAELEALNPTLAENLQIGTVLNVPAVAMLNSATIEDDFDFYEVLPKEGFFRLKLKLGLSQEEIVTLNPYAIDGLKEGMILKIPKENANLNTSLRFEIVDLESRITNKSRKNLAVMLPFQLHKVETDTINSNSKKKKKGGTLRVALDFYSGVLMATEFAKDQGISVHVDVYDTQGSESKTSAIISQNDFTNVDAVIGPLRQKNVEKAASLLRSIKTPVFSPLSNRDMRMYPNFFQTLPTEAMLRKSMLGFLEKNVGDRNVLVISDTKRRIEKDQILKTIPNAKSISPREKGFLYVVDIDTKLDKERENWVILESKDPGIISNVLGLLNGMPVEYKVRLFTLDKNTAYDYHDVSNMHLANLNFTFPSVNKSYSYKEKDPFLVSYKNKYGVYPNRYAVRGFDITYDILLRLASSEDLYNVSEDLFETEYVENKFRYNKNSTGGYQNQATYIIKYNSSLEFEIVE